MTGLTIEDDLFPTSPSHLYEPNIVIINYKVIIGRIIDTLGGVSKEESLDGPSEKQNQNEGGSLMVEFPPFVFILADLVPKDNEYAIENRENAYHYIVEGDLVLECNKIGIHPITNLVQVKFFSTLVDEAQLCKKVIEVHGANHFSPNKEVHDQFPLLEDY